jgi:[ribosomal protein S5]-alanine N-acetyltransferase
VVLKGYSKSLLPELALPMTPIFETKRLTLRPVTLDDAPATQRLFPQWEIVRNLGHNIPWPYPEDGALQFYRDVALPAMERGEQWLWAIRLKQGPSHLVGCIGLNIVRDNNRGFWVGLPWQGRGIMQEACETVTDFWFNGLGRDKLRVAKSVGNIASRRITEKEGSRLVAIEDRVFRMGATQAEIWEMTKEEWNARRRNAADQRLSMSA